MTDRGQLTTPPIYHKILVGAIVVWSVVMGYSQHGVRGAVLAGIVLTFVGLANVGTSEAVRQVR